MAQKRSKIPDGFKNGYLEYVREAPDKVNAYQKVRYVVARCVCGVEKEYSFGNFYGGNSRSCGCKKGKMISDTIRMKDLENKSITRDLYIMRAAARAADKKRLDDIYEKIKLAEDSGDFAEMMEWTLVLLGRGDKSEVITNKECLTVGNFVF